ncbi:Crp/Fnr family transcriptional regulator [Paenibacillus sp. P26]|nr:Crp/Fnr family transcriptional regulator [Paenibacillus sp. P26]
MRPYPPERITALFPCFSSLTPEDWKSVQLLSVDPSTEHSIHEGHVLQHALFIVQGRIRIYKISESGREVTLYRIGDGECCSLMMCSILGEIEYEASAEVETRADILLVPIPRFKQWLDQYKPLKQFIFKQISQRVIDVTGPLDDIAFKPIHHRLAEFLLKITADGSQRLFITHERLSVELGTAREVVSRTLKDWERQGILRLGRGRIELIRRTELEPFAANVTKSR